MSYQKILDLLPIWILFPATVAVILAAIEGGFRLGRIRRRYSEREDRPPLGEAIAATLGLLGLMLAFTFQLVALRFDIRRELVVDEANAIGATYLRAAFLPEPYRADVRSLLRDYVDIRLQAVQPNQLGMSIRRSEELQRRLWDQVVAASARNPESNIASLFVASLNEVISLHAKRLALGARNRVPGSI